MNFLSREEINASYISFLTAHYQSGELPYNSPIDHCRLLSLEEVAILLGFEAADLGGFIVAYPEIIPFLRFGTDIVFEREKIFTWYLDYAFPLMVKQRTEVLSEGLNMLPNLGYVLDTLLNLELPEDA